MKYYTAYDNQGRTLKEVRELAREACEAVLERLGLDLVRDRNGRALKEVHVNVTVKEH